MKIDPYCQQQRCNTLNVLFSISLCSLRWFAVDFFARGPSYTHCCRALTLALARLSCFSFYCSRRMLITRSPHSMPRKRVRRRRLSSVSIRYSAGIIRIHRNRTQSQTSRKLRCLRSVRYRNLQSSHLFVLAAASHCSIQERCTWPTLPVHLHGDSSSSWSLVP